MEIFEERLFLLEVVLKGLRYHAVIGGVFSFSFFLMGKVQLIALSFVEPIWKVVVPSKVDSSPFSFFLLGTGVWEYFDY